MMKQIERTLIPVEHGRENTSYNDNVKNVQPLIKVSGLNKSLSIYDGVLYIDDVAVARLLDHTIGDLVHMMYNDFNIDAKVFPGCSNINSIYLVNFANTLVTEKIIDSIPTEYGSIFSKLINNITGNYKANVTRSVPEYLNQDIGEMSVVDNNIFSSTESLGKPISILHRANNFILFGSTISIISDIKLYSDNRIVFDAIAQTNANIKGIENAKDTLFD